MGDDEGRLVADQANQTVQSSAAKATYSSSGGWIGDVKALACMLRSMSLNGELAGNDLRMPRPGDCGMSG